ncbi:MAG: vanadium-dependent haloperoxidase [Geminicoccaceae bacterium]
MRKIDARKHRETAAKIAEDRQHPVHVANGEERAYRDDRSFMSFTKGLPHRVEDGLVQDELDPVRLRTAIDSGYTRDFDLGVPLGDRDDDGDLRWHFFEDAVGHRKWEAPTAGFVYDLQGPDAQAVTMPPAPPIVVQNQPGKVHGYTGDDSRHGVEANPELVAEMAEVYWLALLRDQPLAALDDAPGTPVNAEVQQAVDHLKSLDFYQHAKGKHPRRRLIGYEELTRQNVFRGHTAGEREGPYLSQFMLMGDEHIANAHATEDGKLSYGSIRIDMKVRKAKAGRDYMTHWNEWLDVQNGADVGGTQEYEPAMEGAGDAGFRFIATPRDLATYVHFDALYEAYLNACLWLLKAGAPFDPNFRHLLGGTKHTTGFALYGGPHILSLMTEVATRGLKAVRFQKFNTHLRLRPEALAGLIAAQGGAKLDDKADDHVGLLHAALNTSLDQTDDEGDSLLDKIAAYNAAQNGDNHAGYLNELAADDFAKTANLPLLPMAFPEGSPMHPSYGAGHATVAGACVTILKAFFDEEACIVRRGGSVTAVAPGDVEPTDQKVAFVSADDGSQLLDRAGAYGDFLRVGSELDKLAANISIARNMAGVHYYSDYIDSLRMGEEIAIGVLQEQSIMYPKDPFQVSLTSFDGKRVIIGEGEVQCLDPHGDYQQDPVDHTALLALLKQNQKLMAERDAWQSGDAGSKVA